MLIPYVRSSLTHSGDQIWQVAGSIAEFGLVNPVLIGADLLEIAGLIAQHLHLVAGGSTCGVAGKALLFTIVHCRLFGQNDSGALYTSALFNISGAMPAFAYRPTMALAPSEV